MPEFNKIKDYGHWKTGKILFSEPFLDTNDVYHGRPYKPGDRYVSYAEYLAQPGAKP